MEAVRRVAPTAFARGEAERKARRVALVDSLAERRDEFRDRNRYYYEEIERLLRFFVPPNKSVLEVGCSTGDLLAALEPRRGLGIDISERLVELASVAIDAVGEMMFQGAGAGALPTASAVVADLVDIAIGRVASRPFLSLGIHPHGIHAERLRGLAQ